MATILVIDDDPDALLLVEAALAGAGHRVVTSTDGRRVADLAAEHGADAVVLDVLMPEISGHDALQVLRERPGTGGVPVLLLSAQAQGQDRVQGLRKGADDFLSKPFEPEELVLRVERLVAQKARPRGGGGEANLKLAEVLREGKLEGSLYLGRYQALEVVGEGGSGLVFRGWDPWLKRPVALKTLRFDRLQVESDTFDRARSSDSASRQVADLLHEAVTAARFSHPNIVTLFDVGGGREHAFLAMEYVDGTSLSAYLKARYRLSAGETIPLAIAVASGLDIAHRNRIVHHDVKPGNVLLGRDGSIKVSDFGVAQLVSTLNATTPTIFGTPGYLPPELLMGGSYSERGDLFGLGAVLYQCLTGELPFAGRNFRQRLVATVRNEAPPARDAVPELSPELGGLLMDLLAKDPENRPASAAEVVSRLRHLPERPDTWNPDFSLLPSSRERTGHSSRVVSSGDLAAVTG